MRPSAPAAVSTNDAQLVLVGDVERSRDVAVTGKLFHELLQAVGSPRSEGQASARRGERASGLGPDPARGA